MYILFKRKEKYITILNILPSQKTYIIIIFLSSEFPLLNP